MWIKTEDNFGEQLHMGYSHAAHGEAGAQSRIGTVSYGSFVMELRPVWECWYPVMP